MKATVACRVFSHQPGIGKNLKTARIVDLEEGGFGLEYDTNVERRSSTRLEAVTYEKAVDEARLFLDINHENIDSDGTKWEVE